MATALGTALYKIFSHFHFLLTDTAITMDERSRLGDIFSLIQDTLIDEMPPKLRDTTRLYLGEYFQERLSAGADPIAVGGDLLSSMLKYRPRNRSRVSAGEAHRKSCLPRRDEEIPGQIDVTHELYKTRGTLSNSRS